MVKPLSFGQRLRMLRTEAGMSRNAFARFLGIPQPSLCMYEKDVNEPAMGRLIQIAQKCNTSTDWLCGLTDKRNFSEELEQLLFLLDGMEPTTNEWETYISKNERPIIYR